MDLLKSKTFQDRLKAFDLWEAKHPYPFLSNIGHFSLSRPSFPSIQDMTFLYTM